MKGEAVNELKCGYQSNRGGLKYQGRAQPVIKDGQFVGSEAYLFNVTSMLQAERDLGKMSDFQNLLMQISTEYINAPVSEINKLINQSLAEIADFSSADRAYVLG